MGLFTRAAPTRQRAWIGRSRGLTASAESARQAPEGLKRLAMPWQHQALQRYDDTGELHAPTQYQARAMERIRYFPAILDDKGKPQESDDKTLRELFDRIVTPNGSPGDLSELAGSYARLQNIVGDGLLTVSQWDGDEVWEYLSPLEMRVDPLEDKNAPQKYRRIRAPGITQEDLVEAPDNDFERLTGDDVRVWRLWRRHPSYSQWADSPVRPLLGLYALLNRLTLAVYAEATSRAAQRGAFFLPSELSFGPADKTQEENPEEDPMMREFQTAMQRAISNPESAEAMSPFFLRAPGLTMTAGGAVPTADLIRWIRLGPDDRYMEGEMWEKTISRIAVGQDLPKEMLTGIEDVSHWSAWFLDEVGFRQHTGPTVVRFVGDLSAAYLRPAAIDARVENAERVVVWFDPAEAVNHPDETGVVSTAHKALVVSDAYYRKKIGASDDDAPDDDELARRVAIQLREFPSDLDPEREEDGQTPPTQGGRGGDVEEGPPSGTTERPPGNRPPSPSPDMAAMIIGAAMMQVDRARELAGNRIWRRAQSCEPCRETAKNVKTTLIASALGPEQVRDVIDGYTTEQRLVDGVAESFAHRLESWGVNGGWPQQLGQMVEQHALRTLYEREVPPLPSGFRAAVQRALTG